MTYFIMPNNSCSMKYAPKSVPGLADVEVLPGIEVLAGFVATKARWKKLTYARLISMKS